jgi:hypothetical protein
MQICEKQHGTRPTPSVATRFVHIPRAREREGDWSHSGRGMWRPSLACGSRAFRSGGAYAQRERPARGRRDVWVIGWLAVISIRVAPRANVAVLGAELTWRVSLPHAGCRSPRPECRAVLRRFARCNGSSVGREYLQATGES